MATLRYGNSSSVELEFDRCELIAECGNGRPVVAVNVAEQVGSVLAAPTGIPPLSRCLTPSDQVVIAQEDGLPGGAEISAAVVEYLADAGVDPDGIRVLRSAADAAQGSNNPLPLLSEDLQSRVRLLDHEPGNQNSLAFLATARSGNPVWLNRVLADADMVIPIGCVHGRAVPGHFGLHGAVYPTFADKEAQKRFRSPTALGARGRYRRSLVDAVEEVGWLLGIVFTIQVVPGVGDSPGEIVAGGVDAVRRQARALYRKHWRWDVPHRARIVVAGIEGGPRQQTWRNLARSLAAAMECVEDEGAIVLCCQMSETPGEGVECLRTSRSRQEAVRKITDSPPADALVVAEMVRALDRVDVYFRSGLDRGLLEDLMISPIDTDAELNRLISRFPSGILLGNAPLTFTRLTEPQV
ncbi:MAG: lactate racemase domain-containing protein [Thermoguttaceae bacterium]